MQNVKKRSSYELQKTKKTKLRGKKLMADIFRDRYLYVMLVPFLLYYILFFYKPMGALQIAFKDYDPITGIADSPWVGLKHFITFFTGPFAWRTIRNTFTINIISLVTVFPLTIVFALLLNEIPHKRIRSFVQTVSYMPHFISAVVVAGLVVSFLSPSSGIINILISKLGFEKKYFLIDPSYFKTIYTIMGGWQSIGFNTIIYTSAISSIDETLYEAATIDGAGRFRKIWHITLAGIMPTISIMLIMRIGRMLSVGYESIILLYQPSTYETADVISTFVYRKGLIDSDYSFSTAIGLFNGIISLILVVMANKVSKKISETSIW